MKFCNMFTWPFTSASEVVPSHCMLTSPGAFLVAHSAPRRTCSQKEKPMALGTTASRTGAFAPLPPPPPWLPPPPPDSLTCAPQAAAARRARAATRSTARICLLRIRSSFFLYVPTPTRRRAYGAVLIPEHSQPDHDTDNHLLVEGIHVQKDRAVEDQGYEESSDQGPNHSPLPPEEARPPMTAAAIASSSSPIPK